MSETSLPVTPGSGVNVAGNTDGAGNFLQSVGIEDIAGGGVASVLIPGTPQSLGNALLTAGAIWSNTFSVTSVTAGTVYDAGNYASVKLQINSQYTGTTPTITFQVSEDNSNWSTQNLHPITGGASAGSTTGTGIFAGTLSARYFRLNFTGTYSSGTAAGLVVFSTTPFIPPTIGAALQAGPVQNIGSAVPGSAIFIGGNNGGNVAGYNALGQVNTDNVGMSSSFPVGLYAYNNANWDRIRNNLALSSLASAARTVATQSADQTNFNWRGIRTILSVTAASGTGGLQLQLQGKDSTSGSYYQINTTPTAVTATGVYVYDVYPGESGTQAGITQVINSLVPRTFRHNVAVGDASSYTYSISYEGIK